MQNGDEELLEVQTATVARETIIQKVNATGRIQPRTQIRISADVSARITVLHVHFKLTCPCFKLKRINGNPHNVAIFTNV